VAGNSAKLLLCLFSYLFIGCVKKSESIVVFPDLRVLVIKATIQTHIIGEFVRVFSGRYATDAESVTLFRDEFDLIQAHIRVDFNHHKIVDLPPPGQCIARQFKHFSCQVDLAVFGMHRIPEENVALVLEMAIFITLHFLCHLFSPG